jgi:glycosyltransferase involved in cell wall biosynthesis
MLEISIIVPIVERYDDLHKLYTEFSKAFDQLKRPYEFIFVVDGGFEKAFEELKKIKKDHPNIKIVKLNKSFGESVAISIAVEKCRGDIVFTLAPYFQVEPDTVREIWDKLNSGYDLVITRRYPRVDAKINQLQSAVFHWIIGKITSVYFHDMSCGLKGMRKQVLNEINLYGDLHRFIPVLANKQGFKIAEIKAKQRKEDTVIRLVKPGAYTRRLLDILTVFFITKFTMKPLRFFGLIGSGLVGIGGVITAYLGLYRLLGYGGISDRPLLLLGIMLMVLGIQTLSIGLIGEIIIFTHARDIKEYNVEAFLDND